MLDLKEFRANGEKFRLKDLDTRSTGEFEEKNEAEERLTENIKEMAEWQDKLYAQNKYALLLIFQAMDTAGKDGVIRRVMSGLNPQGTQVYAFKQPSAEELDHDYLWRVNRCLPERGRIGIFNRSYYEEVLVVRVHDLLKAQRLPDTGGDIWGQRYRQIRDYERYLYENGIIPVKFFLHISKEQQKERLLARIEDPAKNWKFDEGDIKERAHWDEYQNCYQEAIATTATEYAPWYVIPADRKWYARFLVSEIVLRTLKELKPEYPKLKAEQLESLAHCKEILLRE